MQRIATYLLLSFQLIPDMSMLMRSAYYVWRLQLRVCIVCNPLTSNSVRYSCLVRDPKELVVLCLLLVVLGLLIGFDGADYLLRLMLYWGWSGPRIVDRYFKPFIQFLAAYCIVQWNVRVNALMLRRKDWCTGLSYFRNFVQHCWIKWVW